MGRFPCAHQIEQSPQPRQRRWVFLGVGKIMQLRFSHFNNTVQLLPQLDLLSHDGALLGITVLKAVAKIFRRKKSFQLLSGLESMALS